MKWLLRYPLIITLIFQLTILILLAKDLIFLATATKLLLFSVSFLSVCIACYTSLTQAKIRQAIQWLIAAVLVFLTIVKVFFKADFPEWWILLSVLFIQVHLYLDAHFQKGASRTLFAVFGGAILLSVVFTYFGYIRLPEEYILLTLAIYSFWGLISVLKTIKNHA